MADDHQDRTTSHAKSVDGLVQQESSLDRARALKEQFQQAQKQHQQSHQTEQVKGSAQQGSQMVKARAPGQHLQPRGPAREAMAQREHNANLQKEDSIEKQRLENARKARETLKQRQQHERDQDRDK